MSDRVLQFMTCNTGVRLWFKEATIKHGVKDVMIIGFLNRLHSNFIAASLYSLYVLIVVNKGKKFSICCMNREKV